MYSSDLIAEVKELYPDSKDMHKMAEEGNVFLGRYLDDSRGAVGIDEILTALTLEEIQVKARLAKRKNNLYSKWRDQDPRRG